MAVCTLCGCGLPFGADDRTEGEKKYPEFITIDVFDTQANIPGLQRGWFAHIIKEKFNMQMNIIAPNRDGNGDAVYETMRASGRLGDLILTSVDDGRLAELVREGQILDMTNYISDCTNLQKYEYQMKVTSAYAGVDGIWAVPSEISSLSATEPAEYEDPTNAPTLRWDLYKEVGYPEIDTLEDMLDVLRKMQEIAGESDSGQPVYAISLFGDWDGGAMQNAGALASLYGYDTQGFVMLNPETGDIQSVTDDESVYFRALEFLFKANQMGLIDPSSQTQNYENVAAKMNDGAVLYSFWPWMGKSLYNSEEHLSEGKGFASVEMNDASYLSWGNDPDGKQSFSIMIGSGTKDPKRMADFIDWLYSEAGIECCGSPTGDYRGPEGLTWTMSDGVPVLTDFGVSAFINMEKDLEVPEEFGGGYWTQGVSTLNYKPVEKQEVDDGGVPFYYGLFDDYKSRTATIISDDWQKHYNTDLTPIKYYDEKNMVAVLPGTEWASEEYPEYIRTIEVQCKQTLVDYSWKMVFAENREEFNLLRNEMISTLSRLGFEDVLKLNIEDAENRLEVLRKAAEE